jgi:hypothetical protein
MTPELALGLQEAERLAQFGAGNAEPGGKLTFGRQAVAMIQAGLGQIGAKAR